MNETNAAVATTTNRSSNLEMFEYVYTPILVQLGAIGNCLSIYVIFKTKLRKHSSSYYLVALLLSDTLFLGNIFLIWLGMNEINIFNRPIMCECMVYLSSVCSFLSLWLVVAFTAERFVAVRYPLKSKFLCTVRRAKMIIAGLVLIALVIYSPSFIFAGIRDVVNVKGDNVTSCYIKEEWEIEGTYFNVFDFIIAFILPVVIILALNICILENIWKFSNLRNRMTNVPIQSRTTVVQIATNNTKSSSYNLTKMLLIVSTGCLVLSLPSCILRLILYFFELKLVIISNIPLFITLQHYSLILFHTNFGINFVLYCISGQNFRKAVASIFCPKDGVSASTENRTQSMTLSVSRKRRTPPRDL